MQERVDARAEVQEAHRPILLNLNAEMPFRLGSRQYIDLTQLFDQGMARLRKHLGWLKSPEGVLQALKDQLADAQRDLRRALGDAECARINEEIALMQQQIAGQQRAVDGAASAPATTPSSAGVAGAAGQDRPAQPAAGIEQNKNIVSVSARVFFILCMFCSDVLKQLLLKQNQKQQIFDIGIANSWKYCDGRSNAEMGLKSLHTKSRLEFCEKFQEYMVQYNQEFDLIKF